jgi:hypothetical protein
MASIKKPLRYNLVKLLLAVPFYVENTYINILNVLLLKTEVEYMFRMRPTHYLIILMEQHNLLQKVNFFLSYLLFELRNQAL